MWGLFLGSKMWTNSVEEEPKHSMPPRGVTQKEIKSNGLQTETEIHQQMFESESALEEENDGE